MADDFDPYYTWLAIPPSETAGGGPDHYRLLGLPRFEDNPDVISNATDQRTHFLRTLQTGRHSALSQRLLNEVAAAAGCLLNRERKAAYDQQLRSEQARRPAAPLAGEPALRPQYSAALLPQPAPVTVTIPPATQASSAPARSRSGTLQIVAAIVVPSLIALIAAIVLSLGPGEPAGGPTTNVPPPQPPDTRPAATVSARPPAPLPSPPPAADPQSAATIPPPAAATTSSAIAASAPQPRFVPGEGLDLLGWAASDLRLIRGNATYDAAGLTTARDPTAFTLPAEFPDEYVLEADVTRESGTNSLCFGIPVHGRPLTAVVDGFYSTKSGLASVDNREIYTDGNPLVKSGAVLKNGEQSTVRIEVTKDAVRLAVDGRTIVAWAWDPQAKVRSAQGMMASDLSRLHVFTWDASYRFTRLELLPP